MSRTPHARTILLAVLSGLAVTSVVVASMVTAPTLSAAHVSGAEAAGASSLLPDAREASVMMAAAGLTAENLAAAGFSRQDAEQAFDAMYAHCTRFDALVQYRLASKKLNIAKERAVQPPGKKPTMPGDVQLTVAQAQTGLDEVKTAAFNAATALVASGKKAKLATIRSNSHWGLPGPYLLGTHDGAGWLKLRGALAEKRTCERDGRDLPAALAQLISSAESDEAVATAKADTARDLANIKAGLHARAHPATDAGGGGQP